MPDFMRLAKDGNIGAIEVLMNKPFGSQGVVVRVDKSDSTLKITLKSPSDSGPDQKLAERVKAGLGKVKPKGFAGAVIEGRTIKSDKLVWSTQWGVIHAASKPQPVMPPSKIVKERNPSGDFELDVDLGGHRNWVVLGLLGILAGMGTWAWWITRFERQAASRANSEPTTARVASPSPSKPKTPAVTPREFDSFKQIVIAADPDQTVITQVQQVGSTELLYLTVGQGFIFDNEVNQGDLAISLRDAWNKTCDCYGQLVFQSPGGQELVSIAAFGEPKFRKR